MSVIEIMLSDRQKEELDAKAARIDVPPDDLIRLGVDTILHQPDAEVRQSVDELSTSRAKVFGSWYNAWREQYQVESLGLDPDAIFNDTRDTAAGREVTW